MVARKAAALCFALMLAVPASTLRLPGQQSTCDSLVDEYFGTRLWKDAVPAEPDSMLYFLHIPRTAGRTFHSCFLKPAQPPSQRCAKSYDVLRLNTSIPNCGLLSSHDDFSVVQYLPQVAAVVTQLRDPVQRVLSAYEFAVEVAARALAPAPRKVDPNKVNTRSVWPWSLLVPWLEADLRARKAALDASNRDKQVPLDPYHNELVMPLADFVKHPFVEDLLHNGATLQVLGLTNYSHWQEAAALRACLASHGPWQQRLLEVALRRLDHFLHVGVTERLDDSVLSLAATLNWNLSEQAWKSAASDAFTYEIELPQAPGNQSADVKQLAQTVAELEREMSHVGQSILLKDGAQAGNPQAVPDPKVGGLADLQRRLAAARAQLAGALGGHAVPARQVRPDSDFRQAVPLARAFRECAERARGKNRARREASFRTLALPDGRRVAFTHSARALIAPETLQELRQRNSLDLALYSKAKMLLEGKLAEHQQAGRLQQLPPSAAHDAKQQRSSRRHPRPHRRQRVDDDEL